jgi:hypothetical protein
MSKQNDPSDDRAQRLREYLDEVHRRNEESRAQRERLAGTPEVGIFWVLNGKLIIAGAWMEESITTGRFAHYPTTHEKEWSLCQRVGAVPRGMQCDDPPRGRVDFDKVTQKFHLYADNCILRDGAVMEKIRKDLNLPPEILILPDNLYQCRQCLGLSASDFSSSRRRRKRGFAFNREEYMYQVGSLICRALFYYFHARIDAAENTDPLGDNEVRRLIDLQLPNWIAIAPTNGRFSRDKAIEEEIGQVVRKTTRTWTTVVNGAAKRLETDPSTLRLPDRQNLEMAFFSWVRANCATDLQGEKAGRMPAHPEHVFMVWGHVCAALAYNFQKEIAVTNGYLTHVIWFEDRVDTYLEGRLCDWIDIRRRRSKRDDSVAIRAGVDLVPTDRIWNFAVDEIALQRGKPASELVLPNRQAIEAAFFRKVDDVCAAAVRGERHEEREPDDEV